jgi:ribonuclease P protein component
MPDFTFKRGERLKSRKVIEQMFKRGQSFAQYPLRIVWVDMEERRSDFPAQFALSVSKKKFKRAVDRNRIRRLVREAYRLNKHVLYEGLEEGRIGGREDGSIGGREDGRMGRGKERDKERTASSEQQTASNQIGLMVIYTASEILSFEEIEQAMRKMLRRFVKKLRADNQN